METNTTPPEMPPVTAPPITSVQPSLLDLLLKQQLGSSTPTAELLAHGLLGFQNPSLLGTSNLDCSLISSLSSLPTQSITYSSPLTYANPFLTSSPLLKTVDSFEKFENEIKESSPCPAAQLSELHLSMPTTTQEEPAPVLTPVILNGNSAVLSEAEPFTSNLMIAPGADRSHPLFSHFLATVRELERQMLYEYQKA